MSTLLSLCRCLCPCLCQDPLKLLRRGLRYALQTCTLCASHICTLRLAIPACSGQLPHAYNCRHKGSASVHTHTGYRVAPEPPAQINHIVHMPEPAVCVCGTAVSPQVPVPVPVPVPGPTKVITRTKTVEVPGPTQYVEKRVDVPVPTPGPTQYVEKRVDVPVPVPGPTQYVEKRVDVPVPVPTPVIVSVQSLFTQLCSAGTDACVATSAVPMRRL
jgi:hypothetical protein